MKQCARQPAGRSPRIEPSFEQLEQAAGTLVMAKREEVAKVQVGAQCASKSGLFHEEMERLADMRRYASQVQLGPHLVE